MQQTRLKRILLQDTNTKVVCGTRHQLVLVLCAQHSERYKNRLFCVIRPRMAAELLIGNLLVLDDWVKGESMSIVIFRIYSNNDQTFNYPVIK